MTKKARSYRKKLTARRLAPKRNNHVGGGSLQRSLVPNGALFSIQTMPPSPPPPGRVFAIWLAVLGFSAQEIGIWALPTHERLSMAAASRARRAESENRSSLLVEPQSSNPAQLLACLRRHLYTPAACTSVNLTENHVTSPPPPQAGCMAGGTVCHYGRGRCAYNTARGWFCKCTDTPEIARGHSRYLIEATLQPDCIP